MKKFLNLLFLRLKKKYYFEKWYNSGNMIDKDRWIKTIDQIVKIEAKHK